MYAAEFERWGAERGVIVHNDGTTGNEDRLGAMGDVRFAMDEGAIDDDGLLVIAADNLFEFSIADYIAFWREKGDGSAIAVHQLADPALASLYGVVELDAGDRVIGMEEKPEHPRSDLVSTATYLFSREHLSVLERYLADGLPADPPGRFLAWLSENDRVYGYRFSETGSTSATTGSSSRPTTCTGKPRGFPSATPTLPSCRTRAGCSLARVSA